MSLYPPNFDKRLSVAFKVFDFVKSEHLEIDP